MAQSRDINFGNFRIKTKSVPYTRFPAIPDDLKERIDKFYKKFQSELYEKAISNSSNVPPRSLSVEELDRWIEEMRPVIIYVSPSVKDLEHFFKFSPDSDKWMRREDRRRRYLMAPAVFEKLEKLVPDIRNKVEIHFSEY